jgi:general secretion pathway protein L
MTMGPRAGIYLGDEQLTVAVVGRGDAQCFGVELGDVPGARLKAELDNRNLKLRRIRLGLARPLVTVKALELPPAAAGAQFAEMVGFELERHVPFPPEDVRFDWMPLAGADTTQTRVLVVACERRTVEGALRLLEESRVKPASLTVACHNLPALVARRSRGGWVVWAHRVNGAANVLCLGQGRLHLSRTVPVPTEADLAAEIDATLRLLGWPGCDAIWVSGDGADELLVSPALAGLTGAVSAPPWTAAAEAVMARLPADDLGRNMLAVAVALGPRRPALDLLPVELRPRTISAGQIVTAGTVAVTVLLALGLVLAQGYRQHRYATQLGDALRQLDPEVKTVERLSAELAQRKRLLQTVEAIEHSEPRPLPVMRELTDRLPQDAWLRTLTMDRQGLEITGQAAAANQLIPILENSASLTRVEFTAPVTKAGDKEQFRIKAAWKAPAAPAPAAAAEPAPASPPSRPVGPSARTRR